jgi:glutamate 5-kinase
MLPIASFITACRDQGKEIILVSSGAVAAGLSLQPRLAAKPQKTVPEKQALAAIGQSMLMSTWSRLLDFPCAQLLLTYDDILNRKRFINAQNTLKELMRMNTLPIVNENDTVATDELTVGDNDNLAAFVAILANADLLIICSDIDGLFESDPKTDPNARHIPEVDNIDESIYGFAGGTTTKIGTGGMVTKIQAAEKATSGGIHTIIMNGKKHPFFTLLLDGILCGTIFKKHIQPTLGRKHWMLHALHSAGKLYVDQGAANAIASKGASLLPSGIVGSEGEFQEGDAVSVYEKSNRGIHLLAKGITHFSTKDLSKIIGKKSSEISQVLDHHRSDVVIHRENMVLLSSEGPNSEPI